MLKILPKFFYITKLCEGIFFLLFKKVLLVEMRISKLINYSTKYVSHLGNKSSGMHE